MIHCFYKQSLKLVAVVFFFFTCCLQLQDALAQDYDCGVVGCSGTGAAGTYCTYPSTVEKGCRCFDGVDNDGDGKIDKADSNCATYYGLTFVGEGSDCSITPPGANTPFDLVNAPITSQQNTADTQSKVSVGDVDGDGVPDAVITSKWNAEMRVVATAVGSDGVAAGFVKSDFKLSGNVSNNMFADADKKGDCATQNLLFEHENLIADIDGDGKAELFGVVSNRQGNPDTPPTCFFLVGFKYAKDDLIPLFNAVKIGTDRPGTFGIADMDGDGKAEIYLRDRIYAAETGKLLATADGTTSTTNWDIDVTSAPTAANITGDNKLELICGSKIFTIPSLTSRSPASPSTLTLYKNMNDLTTDDFYVKIMVDPVEYGTDTHSSCSIADIDKDGNIDVIISGALNSTSGKTAIFYWNVAKGKTSYYLPIDPSNTNGWPWGTGRVNLIDTDKDGLLDLFFIAGNQIYRVETVGDSFSSTINSAQTGVTQKTINDSRSGVLTVTVYDFDNDGNFELVYRDSQELAVVDAATMSTKYWSATCQSHTYTEGPIIADVNGDGGTDICVPCNTNNSFTITDGIQQQALGQFRLYYSSGNEWLPTRQVWNQPGYFVVNINDDLTLPFPQLDQTLVFGTAPCPNGLPGPQEPLNVFLNQVPYLSANGCPVFPAPDLTFYGDDPDFPGVDTNGDGVVGNYAVTVIPPKCGETQITVQIRLTNSGDLPITASVPVSFFNGDPTKATISSDSLLYSTNINVSLAVDATNTYSVTFNGPGTAFRLYSVLYNNGATLPISLSGASTVECTISNNMYDAYVDPLKLTVVIIKEKDNEKCSNAALDNGALRATVYKNGNATPETDLSPYSFTWYSGPATSPGAIKGTGVTITGLAEGTYSLQAKHIAKGCVSTLDDEVINRLGHDFVASVNVLSDQTKCDPPNGSLQATVNDAGTYTYTWTNGTGATIGSTSTISGLEKADGPFLVHVVAPDGCDDFEQGVIQGPTYPVPTPSTVADVVDCLNTSSGAVTSGVTILGTPQTDLSGFSFTWYKYDGTLTPSRGTVLPGGLTTASRSGLTAGDYEVVVLDNTTGCSSDNDGDNVVYKTTVGSSLVTPTVTPSQLQAQMSCEPNTMATGSATATAVPALPVGQKYTYKWYLCDNTLDANKVGTSQVLTGMLGGGQVYTVKAETPNHCSDTELIVISDNVVKPIVKLDSADNSICNPLLATSTYNGKAFFQSATFQGASITDFTGYTIKWFTGATTTSQIAGESGTSLLNKQGGSYTVTLRNETYLCTSDPVTVQVFDRVALPVIKTDSIASIACVAAKATGQAKVTLVDGVAPAAPYSFQWYTGAAATAGQELIGENGAATLANKLGGPAAYFTVKVTNGTTGCENTKTVLIPDAKVTPVFTLAPQPNSICDPTFGTRTGRIDATITNQGSAPIGDYTFIWKDLDPITPATYNGVGGAVNGETLLQLDSSDYTLQITQTSTGCQSAIVATTVTSTKSLPIIEAVAHASTNCAPVAGNGWVEVTDIDNLGVTPPPSTHLYSWSTGSTYNPGAIIASDYKTAQNLQGASGTFFTVLVTDKSDGCTNTFTIELPDEHELPEFTLDPSPNSICDPTIAGTPYNGQIDATISNMGSFLISEYHFKWTDIEEATTYEGDGTGLNGKLLIGLDSGHYSLVVKNTTTGCLSLPVNTQVLSQKVLPIISAQAVASTNCVPDKTGNGYLKVTNIDNAMPADVPTDHIYRWNIGNTYSAAPADLVVANAAETPHTLQGGVTEFYTVKVTDTKDGCFNTFTLNLPDQHILPLLSLSPTPNSICDPSIAGVPYDGQIVATITNAASFTTPAFKYTWTNPSDPADSSFPSNAVGTLTQIDSGTYQLIVKDDFTGCSSAPMTSDVLSNKVLPIIEAAAVASKNCDGGDPDGQVMVTDIDNANSAVPADHNYSWSRGATYDATKIVANTPTSLDTLQGATGNFYTVKATDTKDGCANTFTVEVLDQHVLPLFTLNPTPNSICNTAFAPYDGQIDATITNGASFTTANFTYDWSNLDPSSTNTGTPVGQSLTQIDSGNFSLVITHVETNCSSDPQTVEVLSIKVLPIIEAVANHSTNCDGGDPNGSVQVTDIDNANSAVPGDHNYSWSRGATYDATKIIANTPTSLDTLQGATGNFYTVLVTDTKDGCPNTFSVELLDKHVLPLFTLNPTPNSICNTAFAPYDGQIDATITNGASFTTANFTYDWDNVDPLSTNTGTPVGQSLTQIDSGNFSLVITHVETNCSSDPQTVEVLSIKVLPIIEAVANHSTNCDGGDPNGSVQVTDIDNANSAVPGDHNYSWSRGATYDATKIIANTPTSLDTLQGATGNFYTVLVTDTKDGCPNTFSVELMDKHVLPLFDLAASPNSVCDPTFADYEGQIDATINNMASFTTANFTYDWSNLDATSTNTGIPVGQSLTQLDSGNFSLVITHVETNCISDPETIEVLANKVLPVIETDATASTNCEPFAADGVTRLANGFVEVTDVDAGAPLGGYNYVWYRGNVVLAGNEVEGTNNPVTLDTLQGSATSIYTVLVTNKSDGCPNTQSILLPSSPVPPQFTLAPSPNTICDPTKTTPVGADYDGSVAVTITNQGAFAITDYHFTWTDEEDNSTPLDADGGSGGELLDKVDSSFYSLVIKQLSTGCETGPVSTEVKANFTPPAFTIAEVPQTSCDPLAPNGILTTTTADNTLYDFEWRTGNIAGAGTTVADSPEGEISGQPGNLYYNVLVRTKATGCENTETTYLNETIIKPTVVLNGILPQADCTNPDGSVTATVSPALSMTNSYEFFWMREKPLTTTTDPAAVITEATTNLGPGATTGFYNRHVVGAAADEVDTNPGLVYGTYTMVVKDVYTSCVSETYTAVIPDQTKATISIIVNAPPTTCNAVGSMDITAVRDDGTMTTFDFEIFKGGPVNTTVPIDYYSNPANPPVFDLGLNNADGGDSDTNPDPLGTVSSTSGVTVTTAAMFNSYLYTVVATDGKGCKNMEDYFLPFQDAHDITSVFENSTICPYTEGNGTISFKSKAPSSGIYQYVNRTDFTYKVYKGGVPTAGNEITVPSVAPNPTFIISEVAGDGIDNDADGTIDESEAFVEGTNPYSWAPASIEKCNTAGVDEDGDGLFDATDPDCQAYVSAVRLAPGFYTVEVRETYSGSNCPVYAGFEIKSSALDPQITLADAIKANSACDKSQADGSIEIQVARHPDDATPGAITFDVDVDNGGAPTQIGNDIAELATALADDLAPDTYNFTVTASTGCQSTKSFTILDQPNIAQIIDGNVTITHAEYCDPTLEQSARAEITLLSVTDSQEIDGNGIDDDGDGFIDAADPDFNDNLADYEFTWYTDAALTQIVMPTTDGQLVADGGEVLTNNVNIAAGKYVTIGTYYVVAVKEDEGMTGGVGCFSAPFKVDIEDKTVNPVATLSPFGNSACNTTFEGRIEVDATTASLGLGGLHTNPGATGTYEYQWTGALTKTTDNNTGNHDNDAGTDDDIEYGLQDGTYNLLVVNEATGCSISASTNIVKISPPVFTLTLSSMPQVLCDADGSVTVVDAFVDGASDGTANFTYQYYQSDPSSAPLAVPNTNTTIDKTDYASIGAGAYYVVATRVDNPDPILNDNWGSGCSSAPHRVDIDDTSVKPTVEITNDANTSCSTGTFEGQVHLKVTAHGSDVSVSPVYTYTWTSTPVAGMPAGTAAADGDGLLADDNYTGLKDGVYKVTAENNNTGCSVDLQTTIIKNELPVIVTSATPTPQTICAADGSILVNTVTVSGAVTANNFFDFTWYVGDPSTVATAAAANNITFDDTDYASIGAGTYYVTAKRTSGSPGLDCISAPLRVDIEDKSEDPTADISNTANTSCSTNTFEGTINITVTDPGSDPGVPTYTYTWDSTPVGSPIASGTTGASDGDGLLVDDNFTGLNDGTYKVTVMNDNTKCTVAVQTTIIKNELPVIVTSATPTPQTICAADGSILVNTVTVSGAVTANNFFDFTWYVGDPSTVATAAAANNITFDDTDYASIGAGTYYVTAKRTSGSPGLDCISAPLRVDIEDKSEDPTADISNTANTSCSTNTFEGTINITVTDPGSDPGMPTYTYTWDSTPVGSPIASGTTGASDGDGLLVDDNFTGLNDGTYKVTVMNDNTKCTVAVQTTIIKNELPVIVTSATPTPQIICDPDGQILVNTVTVSGAVTANNFFDFTWYAGDPSTVATASAANNITFDKTDYATIGAGTYYVTAKRTSGTPGLDCISAPLRVDIEDKTKNPIVTLDTKSNTSCSSDPLEQEGELSIVVTQGSGYVTPTTYTYDWTTTPVNLVADDPAATGNEVYTGVKDGIYQVIVTDNNSKCKMTASTEVLKTELPIVIAETDSDPQTICNPDGLAEVTKVTVDGTEDPVHTNFDFTWYRTDLSTKIIDKVNGEDLIDVNNVTDISSGTYFVEIQVISTAPRGADCKSAPIRIDIGNIAEDPSLSLDPESNTSCSTNYEGQITVNVLPGSKATADYTFTWTSTPVAGSPADDATASATEVYTDLKEGVYALTVLNNASGCSTTGSTEIFKNELPIVVAEAVQTPQVLCDPDGKITVSRITVGGADVDPLDYPDFDFTWYVSDISTVASAATADNDEFDVADYATIGAGTYFVQVKRQLNEPGNGCVSAPLRVDIGDSRLKPTITLEPTADTDCAGTGSGAILLTVVNPGSGPNTGMFDYTWGALPENLGSYTAASPRSETSLVAGTYTVTVENPNSGCQRNGQATIDFTPAPVAILNVDKLDQMICNPDGSITVTAVAPATTGDYTFKWYLADPLSAPLQDALSADITAVTLDKTNYATMGAGTYYIIGTKNLTTTSNGDGCTTPPFRVDIQDLHTDPQLSFSSVKNSSCDVLNGNGSVSVSAIEADLSVGAYTYSWSFNGTPFAEPTNTVSGAETGEYFVTVLNTTTGCSTTSNFNLELDEFRSKPHVVKTAEIHPSDCKPSGESQVMEVTIGGSGNSIIEPPDNKLVQAEFPGRLEFIWHAGDPAAANIVPAPSWILTGLLPGKYYVEVKDLTTTCTSDPKEVIINSDEIVYPVLQITQTKAQASCSTVPGVGSAELAAFADLAAGAPQTNYDFFWYANLTATGTPINGSSSSVISNLDDGPYSVDVYDKTTECHSQDFYIVPDDGPQFAPELSISIEPQTDCLSGNGFIVVRETRNDDEDFFAGYPYRVLDPVTGTMIPNTNFVLTDNGTTITKSSNWIWDITGLLASSSHTIKIVDQNSLCELEITEVVPENFVYPDIDVTPEQPLTNCDPAIPNGQLSALVDGTFVGYDFVWTDADGNVKSLESVARGLTGPATYTVTVTNQETHCTDTETGDIVTAFVYPDKPVAETVEHMRSCVDPDGWVTATVNGETINHYFDWYDNETATGSSTFRGEDYKGLAGTAIYSVIAIDRITGCASQPDTALVKDNRVYPDIFFTTQASFCADVSDTGNGVAELQLSPADVIADDIVWREGQSDETGFVAGSGSYITEQLPGFYTAYVTTSFGCEAEGTTEIPTEILTYNLVTNNSDGTNEVFYIDCLSLFPNNNVKIFNRSGILVYEADHYDNNERVFRGVGEKGVYATGNELPVGTYFYIIDKGDGSKPRTGYLELTR